MRVANLTEPIARRLLTLWKKEGWSDTITACCDTAVGSHLFNISLWTDLSRHRVDDVRMPPPCLPCPRQYVVQRVSANPLVVLV
jgi:hypothetical protein